MEKNEKQEEQEELEELLEEAEGTEEELEELLEEKEQEETTTEEPTTPISVTNTLLSTAKVIAPPRGKSLELAVIKQEEQKQEFDDEQEERPEEYHAFGEQTTTRPDLYGAVDRTEENRDEFYSTNDSSLKYQGAGERTGNLAYTGREEHKGDTQGNNQSLYSGGPPRPGRTANRLGLSSDLEIKSDALEQRNDKLGFGDFGFVKKRNKQEKEDKFYEGKFN